MKCVILFSGVIASLASTVCLAQDLSASPSLEEVIVTAQKRSERLQDVPISITARTAEQLEAAGVVSTSDMTRVVPGLIFAQNEAFSQPSIRGVTTTITTAGAESAVAVYLDGVYQPSQNALLFDLPDVERIEVLKGPQGTLFGRNATGGAIQIFTKDPSFATTGKVTISDGIYTGGSARTANEINTSGFVSGSLVDDVLAGSLSGFYRHNPGYMINDYDDSRSGEQTTWGFRTKLLWQASENVRFTGSAYYSDLDDDASYNRAPYHSFTVAALFPDAVVPTKPWHVSTQSDMPNTLETEQYGVGLRGVIDTSVGTFTTITGYNKSKNNNFVDQGAAYSPLCLAAFSCLRFQVAVGSESLSQEVNFASKQMGAFSMISGLFFYRNFDSSFDVDVLGTASGDAQLLGFQDSVRTTAYAAFTEVNADITEKVHAIVGLRYSREKKRANADVDGVSIPIPRASDSSVTPRASIRYEFTPDTNLYFTYSKGFKSGILPPPTQTPLVVVDPEKLDAYEVGLKTARQNFALNVAYFHYEYKDMQLTRFVGTLAYPQNAGAAEMDGFDVEGSWQITSDIRLTTALNYTPNAKFTDYQGAPLLFQPAIGFGPPISAPDSDASGLRLIRIPKLSGSVGVAWERDFEFGDVGANIDFYHADSFKNDVGGSVNSGAYDDLSARAYIKFPYGLTATVFGKNLQNSVVLNAPGPAEAILPAIYYPPRQVGISLSYDF